MFLLIIMIDVYPTFLLNNFKVIFMPIFNDDHFLAFCLNINIIANVLGTFIWGYIAHRFGNIRTIYLISFITLLGGILGFYSEKYGVIIMFIFIFGLGDKGMETIAGPALVDLFGIKMATALLPYKGLSLIIGFILAPIIQLIT
jgi:MFS family permease